MSRWIDTERKLTEEYALRQVVLEEMCVDWMAEIFRELIQLSDRKIELLQQFEKERDELFGPYIPK
jgi:hypothetical protein